MPRPSDPSIRSVQACRWRFPSGAARADALRRLPARSGALSVHLFEDAEEPALLGVIWGRQAGGSGAHPDWPSVLDIGAGIEWTADAEMIVRWQASADAVPGCLVVVRQPLIRPDREAQRDWISTVLRALDGDAAPPGLLTANFFATGDGGFVLNLAEWTSPAAHREALARGSYGQHGSLGASALWRATREHPAITRDHEVHRYVPCAAGRNSAAPEAA